MHEGYSWRISGCSCFKRRSRSLRGAGVDQLIMRSRFLNWSCSSRLNNSLSLCPFAWVFEDETLTSLKFWERRMWKQTPSDHDGLI